MKHNILRKKIVDSGFMETCDELDIVKLPLMFIEGVVCPMKLYAWNFWECWNEDSLAKLEFECLFTKVLFYFLCSKLDSCFKATVLRKIKRAQGRNHKGKPVLPWLHLNFQLFLTLFQSGGGGTDYRNIEMVTPN